MKALIKNVLYYGSLAIVSVGIVVGAMFLDAYVKAWAFKDVCSQIKGGS